MPGQAEGGLPSPADLDAIGAGFNIPPHRLEELALLRRQGASDAELLTALRAPSDDATIPAKPMPLTENEGAELVTELDRLLS